MDRRIYKIPFTIDKIPEWQCPTCEKGFLFLKKNTFHFKETTGSKNAHSHDAWEPEWITYIYTCLLECNNELCKETVISSGNGNVKYYHSYNEDGIPDYEHEDIFFPQYFNPNLKLIKLFKEIPETVKDSLEESFKLYFYSPAAASNHIRIAIENILTDKKVKRFNNKDGKLKMINLHQRIEQLPAKHNKLKDHLLAVKWLGNAGSHDGKKLTHDDALDAFELMEHILQEIYGQSKNILDTLAKRINKAKGPKKRK